MAEKNHINYINKHIGSQILKYRTKNSMTQAELAEKTDTTAKFISQLENGKTGIRIDTLIKYINALNISPNELFDGLFNNSNRLNTTLKNKIHELNDKQKDLVIDFINMIIKYDNIIN